MTKTAIKLAIGGLLAALFFAAAVAAPSSDSLGQEITTRNNAIIDGLNSLKQSGKISPDSARPLIQKEISPIMDYEYFASQAVGKYWRRASDDEKQQIAAAFQIVLEKVYSKLLAKYSGQKVQVVEHKTRADKKILVGAEVRHNGKKVRIDYIFRIKGETAKIVDVQVEKISLLSAYRRQFGQTIKKAGIAGLVVQLQKLANK